MIDLYSLPSCVQCNATKRAFQTQGLVENQDWTEHDLSLPENESARAWVMEDLGYMQAPIVIIDDDNHWSGFRPDKIVKLQPKGADT